jgi:very-short-patch-repair endonuclease
MSRGACGRRQRADGTSRQAPPVPTPPVPPQITGPTDRRTARAAGVTDWHLRHRGVARTSRDTYLPRSALDDVRTRVDAVLMGAPASAVVSHATAARLWGLEIPLCAEDARVHLTVPPGMRIRHRADRRVHSAAVPDAQVTRRLGIRVTSPGRTWLDLAGAVPPGALLAVTDQMLGRRYPQPTLERLVGGARGMRGVRTARRVLAVADGRAGSPMESVLRWLLLEAGLPAPDLQHVVRDTAGSFIGRVDMAWPEQRVIVEFDGDVHRERRVFVDDVRRQNGLVLAGWTVLRFTSADVLGSPQRVLRLLRAALAGEW